jgi:DNA-directed RNA polymerase specialized sigma24 family protein
VDRDDALLRLPPIYQQVIGWLDEGVAPEEIAERLDIERDAVPTLIGLARAKYARATDQRNAELSEAPRSSRTDAP